MKSLLFAIIIPLILISACAPPKAILKNPDQVLSEIQPYFKVFKPEGKGPFPSVLMLHGATDYAWADEYNNFTNEFTKRGYAAVFVDSYGKRGIDGASLRAGKLLPGERAADLLISLDWLRDQPWADHDRIAVTGHSHGATTIMDTLAMAPPDKLPTGLISSPDNGLEGLKAAILFYPWCSGRVLGVELIKVVENDWSAAVPVLAFLPEKDRISKIDICDEILERHKAKGLPVEIVKYKDAGHSFDFKYDDHGNRVPTYNIEVKSDSYRRMFEFLDRVLK